MPERTTGRTDERRNDVPCDKGVAAVASSHHKSVSRGLLRNELRFLRLVLAVTFPERVVFCLSLLSFLRTMVKLKIHREK